MGEKLENYLIFQGILKCHELHKARQIEEYEGGNAGLKMCIFNTVWSRKAHAISWLFCQL